MYAGVSIAGKRDFGPPPKTSVQTKRDRRQILLDQTLGGTHDRSALSNQKAEGFSALKTAVGSSSGGGYGS